MTKTVKLLERLIDKVEAKLARLESDLGARPDWRNYEASHEWDRRRRTGMDRLLSEFAQEEGARTGLTGAHDHAIRMAGIRSTSTCGWNGALRNWQQAARRRIEKGDPS